MALDVTFTIGSKTLAVLSLGNISPHEDPPEGQSYAYWYRPYDKGSRIRKGLFLPHDYNDGFLPLVYNVLADLMRHHPSLLKQPFGRNRVQCPFCKDVIESIYTHDYRTCRCGKTTVDGGHSYRRCSAHAEPAPGDTKLERKLAQLSTFGPVMFECNVKDKRALFTLAIGTQSFRGGSLSQLVDEALMRFQHEQKKFPSAPKGAKKRVRQKTAGKVLPD